MEGMLEPHLKEVFLGKVLIKQVFKLSKAGIVAGSIVQKGKVTRNAECRVIRNGQPIHKGRISSLKRFKDDVREVPEGYECGITVGNFNDLKAGDIIDCFGVEKIARKL
jgi:translation initiation factor IF-2